MFGRLGRVLVRRARLVLAISVLAIIGAGIVGPHAFGKLHDGGFASPGAQSTVAQNLIDRQFGGDPNLLFLVTATRGSVSDPAVAAQGASLASALARRPGVTAVTSYWQAHAANLRSADGRSALILVNVAGDDSAADSTAKKLVSDFAGAGPTVTVRAAGPLGVGNDINTAVMKGLAIAESFAIPATLLLLLIVFGSVVSALLPLLIALMAVLGTFAELFILGSLTSVSSFATNLTTALALGLAIDYALLTVSRYREELAAGRTVSEAVVRTVETAGRTIVFSAATVAVALATLLVFSPYFLRSLAYAGIGVVVVSAVSGTVVLPAVLALLGHRVNGGKVPFLKATEARKSRFWGRAATIVMRRPVLYAAPIVVLLAVGAIGLSNAQFATPGDTVLPASAVSRQAGDILRADFGGDSTAAIDVVTASAVGRGPLGSYAAQLSALPGVSQVQSSAGRYVAGAPAGSGTRSLSSARADELLVTMNPAIDPQSGQAQDLVKAVRAMPGPPGTQVLAGGVTAQLVDAKRAISDRLPLAILLIVITTFLLLFLFTGSVVLPLRALAANALGLSAILGAMVFVFQDGHFASLLGFTPGPLDTTMPVLLFCVAFGLSMDYEVFLISRVKELHDGGATTQEAVTEGLGRTGRIISTAAALIAVSFFSFAVSTVSFGKFFGIGAGLAVVIDATLMRGALVPATFRLLGERAWYAPGFLRQVHSRVGLHAATADPRPADVT